MYKILILKNVDQIVPESVKQYFAERVPFEIIWEERVVSFPEIEIKPFVVEDDKGFIHMYGAPIPEGRSIERIFFGTKNLKDHVRSVVKECEARQVWALYDPTKAVATLAGTPNFRLTAWTFHNAMYPDTEYIEIPMLDKVWVEGNCMLHEPMHVFAKQGKVLDEMDITIIDGKRYPYHKNDDPYAPDGNYANTFENLVGNWYKVQLSTCDVKPVSEEMFKLLLKQINPFDLRPKIFRMANEFAEKAKKAGLEFAITEGNRSLKRQQELYNQGRTTFGNIVTNARPGYSMHNYGIAFDVVFVKNGKRTYEGDWEALGKLGESIGFEWGGRWKSPVDRPHFQFTAEYSINDLSTGKADFSKFN